MSTPSPEAPDEYVAEAEVSSRRGISIVWLIPLVALAIGAWLVYKAYSEKGPTITVSFEEANGVVAGKTLVRYRDVEIGKVTTVGISDDLKRVTVTAELDKDAARLLGDDAQFWVALPEISITGVRGLQTLLSGPYIGIDPDTEGKRRNAFVGLDKQPLVSDHREGRFITLTSPTRGSLNRGAPVVYRGFAVGKIIDFHLVEDSTTVEVGIFIESPYDQRITDRTRFWNVSGVDLELTADGITVNSKSMATILIGGVTFGEPPGGEPGKSLPPDATLKLFGNREDAFKPQYTERGYLVHFNESVRGLNVGAPVEFRGAKLGEVTDIRAQFNANDLAFRIPVYINVEPERFEIIGEIAATQAERATNLEVLIERGLRAQLKTGSLLTGQKLIELDMFPEAEAASITYEDGLLVVPTTPTLLDTVAEKVTGILDKVERLPLDKIGEDLRATTARVRQLVEQTEIQAAIDALSGTLSEAEILVAKLNKETVPSLDATLEQGERFATTLNSELSPQLGDVLRELKDAARAIRVLSDYLEQHPDALIKGKK